MIFQANGSNYNFTQSIRLLFSGGSENDSNELRAMLETRYGGSAVLFSKGRNALSEAVRVSGAKVTGVNGYTCSVVVEAIVSADSRPKYLDIEDETAHFSAETLQQAVDSTPELGAIIVQNTYGIPCNIAEIEAIARKNHLVLIEDLAHSIGQTYSDGREAGTVGDMVMLSFGRDKLLDIGSGGALVIRQPSLLARVERPTIQSPKKLQSQDRFYPILSWFVRALYPVKIGKLLLAIMFRLNLVSRSSDGGIHREYSLPNWQSRQAVRLFRKLDSTVALRRTKSALYSQLLDSTTNYTSTLRVPFLVKNQSETLSRLRQMHLMLDDIWYDTPIGPKRKYQSFNFPESECPKALNYSRHIINLPTHQFVTPNVQRKLVSVLRKTDRA